jgi:hypothetical protein
MTQNSNESGESYCAHCKADVVPRGKGQCPTCGRVLPGSSLRKSKVAVNAEKVAQQREKLVAYYQPQTPVLEEACHQLAAIVERLDAVKLGSPEHRRLTLLMQSLGDKLEASRPQRRMPIALPEVAGPADERVAAIESTLKRVVTYLLEKDKLDARGAERTPPVDAPPTSSSEPASSPAAAPRAEQLALDFAVESEILSDLSFPPDDPPSTDAPVAAADPPSPLVTKGPEPCKFCYESPCIGRQHPAFFDLHPNERQQQADTDATAVMMRQIGRGLPRWYTE